MPTRSMTASPGDPTPDPGLLLRETVLAGDSRPPALSLQATQAATAATAEDLSLRATQHTDPGPRSHALRDTDHAAIGVGTLETIAPGDVPTVRSRHLPAPDIDAIEADQIRGAIMSDLFGAPAVATKIGRFTVLDRLGEGGMGVVYAAYDAQLDRRVAVKLLRRDTVGNDDAARKRLLREAQAMARLAHPNIITVHEAGEHHGSIYVAMEFVKGKSLDAWQGGKPPWRDVLAVFLAAGAGLAAAHAAGIIHRDFKPHNVMRGDDGSVKVLDFGLARAIDNTDDSASEPRPADQLSLLDARMTRTGAVMGTPAYMAPEQHRGTVADARSDQYCFCVALYEGLFGRLPFAGDTLPVLVANVLAARVLPPPDTTVPRWVTRVVLRGMALEPADRYPSLPDLLADLARDPVRRRNRTLAGLAAATLLVGGGFGLAAVSAGPAPTCTGAADELAAVWSDERREAVRVGLTAAIPNLGATTAAAILPRLDSHADAWIAMRTDACQANQAGRQSDQLLDLRMTCLDRRLARLDALAASFSAADGDTVLNAVAAVEGIGDLSGCADVERLTAAAPLPDDPTRAAGVRTQQLALERVAAAQLTGHYNDARTAADEVTRIARDLEYTPLTAEAALARGRAHQELHEAEPAEAALAEALSAGIRVDADAVAAEAAARQIFVRSTLLHDPKLALAGADVADALVASAGDPPELRWLWEINLGNARFETSDSAAAHLHFRRAADVAAAAGLVQAAALTDANEAYLASRSGDHRTAATGFAASAVAIESALGPDHPTAFQMRMMLAQARGELGQAAGVRDTLATTLPRLIQSFGPDAPDVQSANLLLADVDLKYRRPDAARALAEQVVARPAHPGSLADGERVLGLALIGLGRVDEGLTHLQSAIDRAAEIPTLRLVNLTYRGDALLELGRQGDALAAHREALAGFTAATGADSSFTAIVRSHLARTLLARGALDEALSELRLARDTFLTHQPHSPYLAGIFETLGDIEQARGDSTAAEAALRGASDRYAATFDDDHPDRNAARFKLARVLAARDPATAAALAEQARTIYTTLGPAFAGESAAVTAWLASQPK